MTFNVSQLKSISASTLSTLATKESRSSFSDDRFWTLARDASGNARAIIRILPSIRQGELPWAEQWSYAIKGPGGWYIETSRRTINQPDPMAEYIGERWNNAVTESDKAALRANGLSKARHTYIANILIVNDFAHPENNGQVRLWRFGKKIYDMITDMAKPDPFDETKNGVNVTDWDGGCNFKMMVYTVDKFPRYDKCSFDVPSSIGDDSRIVEIADKMYDLGEFTDPAKIKSYDELKGRLNRVFPDSVRRDGDVERTFSNPLPHSAVASTTVNQPVVKPVIANNPVNKETKSAPWEGDDINLDDLLNDIE